jgi:hypothetical protein
VREHSSYHNIMPAVRYRHADAALEWLKRAYRLHLLLTSSLTGCEPDLSDDTGSGMTADADGTTDKPVRAIALLRYSSESPSSAGTSRSAKHMA